MTALASISRRRALFGALTFGLGATFLMSTPVNAGVLRVQPVSIDLRGGGQAATLTLRNEGRTPITVQSRIFRWVQDKNGKESLVSTRDVVVSPPTATLRAGSDYVLRVVRTAKTPIVGEESYRLLVDELPDPSRMDSGQVALLVRQSIPVFFSAADAGRPTVAWSASTTGNTLVLTAQNTGGRRLRVSDIEVKDASGSSLAKKNGLVGYVLGGSSQSWKLPLRRGAKPGGTVVITGSGDNQPIHARVQVGNR